MFVDVFKLRKSSWHMSLMTYIWGLRYYDFSHICPYFWLSLFNLLIIIPVTFFKVIGGLLKAVFEDVGTYISNRDRNYYTDYAKGIIGKPYKMQEAAELCHERYSRVSDILYRIDRDAWSELAIMRTKYTTERDNTKYQLKAINQERAIIRKKRVNEILSFAKPVVVVVFWALGLAALSWIAYMLYTLVLFIIHHARPVDWPLLGMIVGGVLAGVLIAILLALILTWIINNVKCKVERPKWLRYITGPLKWLFTGIGLFFSIVGQMIQNNCPGIDWED